MRSFKDLVSVILLSIRVNSSRRRIGPQPLVAALRRRGQAGPTRSSVQRSRLRAIIRLVDRWFPSGPNCYRRALVEIGLDAAAAAEPIYMGVRAGGGKKSGHVWLPSEPVPSDKYDATFVV